METDQERLARTGISSLEKTPNRVALADIEAAIAHEENFHPETIPHLTICVIVLKNGWAEVGKSAPADPENFDAALGLKFAREDAIRKLWPLFGFHLREKSHRDIVYRDRDHERPFNPVSEAAEIAGMQERLGNPERHAKLDPEDE